mgnify:CR=1 FL=1
MLEAIRKHSKIVMILLFLLIIPSFVLVGINRNYFSEKSPVVARVDGHDITQAEWDNAHKIETDRLRAQAPSIDPKLLDSPQARYATLERLVRDRVLQAAVQQMRLVTSDSRLARSLQEIPAIAALKRSDGSLDAAAYRALVGAQGMTPESFEAMVRRDLSVNQVMAGVMDSAFATPAQAKPALDALFQRREVQIARLAATDFASRVTPSDADLQAYYQAHSSQFQQPEQASVEYVVLDLDSVASGISVSEDDLRSYYKENLARLSGKEERRARHILIQAPKDAPAAERAKAKARAEELLAQLHKNPATFAELAKKYSDDKGSAAKGGDLGFFARGAMVKPFEDAAFALKKGELSGIVESDFGYHIIELADIKPAATPSFEELRPQLEAELRQQQAQRKFAEVAEVFSNTVYEQADSLRPVAEKLHLKIQSATGVERTPVRTAQGPLANPKFLAALFSSDAIEKKHNTEAIEIGPNQLAAGRITAYTPARTLSFDQVRDQVLKLYVAEKSAELAHKEGEARLAAWRAKPDSATGLGEPLLLSREQPQNQPPAILEAVFRANTDALPAWVGVDLGAQGYAIIKINAVKPPEAPDESTARQRRAQFAQWWASAEGLAYYEWLKARFKVQIKVPRPEPLAQAGA